MNTAEQIEPGTPVRFITGPLGVLADERASKFVDRTVGDGDEGRYERPHPHIDGWHLIAIGELHEQQLVPCHPSQFALVLPVSEIKTGDRFVADGKLVWTAVDDATLIDAEEPSDYGPQWARVRVRFPDGGDDYRNWDDPSIELPLVRGES